MFRENAKLVQLSFGVSLDEAKKEYVERGWWLDVDTGDIFQTLNLRPLKALKYVKGDDSRFGLFEGPCPVHLPRRRGPLKTRLPRNTWRCLFAFWEN